MKNKISFFTILFMILSYQGFSQEEKVSPNVVFILIDDLGSAWIPPYAENLTGKDVEKVIIEEYKQRYPGKFNMEKHLEAARNSMPFVAKLSKEGLKFNKCFTSSALCAPSRAGILTGRYSQGWGGTTIPEVIQGGIPAKYSLLPPLFQKEGYKTALIGKWHVAPRDESLKNSNNNAHYKTSSAPGYHPLDSGFDYYYGYNSPNSTYIAPKDIWQNREMVSAFSENDFLTEILNEKAKAFVKEAVGEKKPFFLYYSPMTIHGGLAPCPSKYSDQFDTGIEYTNNFAGHLLALDKGIEGIYEILEKANQVENTLFILTSDNGGVAPVPPYNAPYKGGKGTGWLGGSHSPLVIVMPGKTIKGFREELVSTLDILPTALDVAGIRVPEGLDGMSLKELLFEGNQANVHDVLYSTGLHSSRWSFSYYNMEHKKIMDHKESPLYTWALDDSFFALYITEVKSGLYRKMPLGLDSKNYFYNYAEDPLNEELLDEDLMKPWIKDKKFKKWLQKIDQTIIERKKEHRLLIDQIN